MGKYTAINIGPIIGTLAMARKPGELWTASYMFSHLMEQLLLRLRDNGFKVISPAMIDDLDEADIAGMDDGSVGLYPDRAFIEHDDDMDVASVLERTVIEDFMETSGTRVGLDYINLMTATTDSAEPIKELNRLLDCTEMMNRPSDDQSIQNVMRLVSGNGVAPRWQKPDIMSIEQIAKIGWIKGEEEYSRHKYICIVQADGDNMGKTISSARDMDEVRGISKSLLRQGIRMVKMIRGYGGTPIYAGGDDMLFLAPVVGKTGDNIFTLLEKMDDEFSDKFKYASMSFGLSITYNKYPLYEALEAARGLLFEKAKKEPGKKTVAWCLRKHSGSGFEGVYSRAQAPEVYSKFRELLAMRTDEKTLSAIAHKLRMNEDLINIVKGDEKRIAALYSAIMDEANTESKEYTKKTRELLCALINAGKENPIPTLYGMLRTAKFISGEKGGDDE